MKQYTRGLTGIEVLLFSAIAIVTVVGVWFLFFKSDSSEQVNEPIASNQNQVNTQLPPEPEVSGPIQWQWDGMSSWRASGKAPACADPIRFSTAPVDSTLISSILYPGQIRGGNYKPHGGLRLTTSRADIKAILDGTVVSGARYIEQDEIQYMFTIVNDCGIAYRFDHLLTLSPVLQALADTLPPAQPNDSSTTNFTNQVKVKAGDILATAIGFNKKANYFFDLGVYDYRKPNIASSDPAFIEKHKQFLAQAGFGLCWLDLFPEADSAKYKSLSAGDQQQGKTSDYCK